MELVELCAVDIVLDDLIWVGDGPAGTRVIAEVREGTITGERLAGHMRGSSSADWLVVNGTTGTLDVRATIETHDGALVYVAYKGRMDVSQGPGAVPFYCAPLFETSDERYQWLNLVQAVGKAQLDGSNLHYDWYEVR
jgi:hypothetical protein